MPLPNFIFLRDGCFVWLLFVCRSFSGVRPSKNIKKSDTKIFGLHPYYSLAPIRTTVQRNLSSLLFLSHSWGMQSSRKDVLFSNAIMCVRHFASTNIWVSKREKIQIFAYGRSYRSQTIERILKCQTWKISSWWYEVSSIGSSSSCNNSTVVRIFSAANLIRLLLNDKIPSSLKINQISYKHFYTGPQLRGRIDGGDAATS